ncbi:AC9 transposase, putative [Rhizoctonia solani AG-3 Rhs1AP]|uniref:AC9 transposase, putative n=2 Tax=Rhizoctonia solani AG-3 TaxID=1086053 RepID=X8JDW2_9AGAM|nr:AC9 transposase, putative [Rhizoctonia solani AG-3 Rhs1AP]KEP52944.1 putative AC9 transposase [Rhizoctonia solani 123E]
MLSYIGCITPNNASSNNTLMEELVKEFQAQGWPFVTKDNHIWFTIVNLAVQAILKVFPKSAADFRGSMANKGQLIDNEAESYLQALDSNPMEAYCTSIVTCRSSGQRCKAFRKTIIEGNALGWFWLPSGEKYTISAIEVLRNTPTRWSSTYTMVKWYLNLYPENPFYNLNA